jgi:PEP-CTERM motif
MKTSLGIIHGLAIFAFAVSASQSAEAGLSISSAVGGAPAGTVEENFDSLLSGTTATTTLPSGITISYDGDAQAVSGSSYGHYAAPYLSGSSGVGFGPSGSSQSSGPDATTYVSISYNGFVTLRFPGLETYVGILWGSVDGYNSLSFYNGATLIGTVTGSDVMASPSGDQGANGTAYVNINATGGSAFDRVVATSGGNAFEFDDVAFNETIPALALAADPISEPTSLGLFGIGLWGLAFVRRR